MEVEFSVDYIDNGTRDYEMLDATSRGPQRSLCGRHCVSVGLWSCDVELHQMEANFPKFRFPSTSFDLGVTNTY